MRRIGRIYSIAKNTFKEAMRDRILYTLIIFAFLILGSSWVIPPLASGEEYRIITDVGLASISIFGVLIVVFLGTSLVYKEVEKRTVYMIVCKPIYRYEFLLGKYFGLFTTILLVVIIMTIFLYFMIYILFGGYEKRLLLSIFMSCIELAVIASIAIFFSSFSSPTLSGIFTILIFAIGHMTEDIISFSKQFPSSVAKFLARVFYYVIPNLENFNIKNEIIHNIQIKNLQIELAIIYGAIYIAVTLFLSALIFERRDFK